LPEGLQRKFRLAEAAVVVEAVVVEAGLAIQ
jgi:hypothetical protein